MAKTGIDVLYDIIQKKNGKYGTAQYASDDISSGLSNINVVDVDEVTDKLRLCRALYSRTLYGLMGIQSLIPSLGKDTLLDIDTVLQSLSADGLTVYDSTDGRTKSVTTYLKEHGLGTGDNPWVQMLKGNNVSKNSDLGNATPFVKDGKNCVRVDISDRTKRLSSAVAKVLAENSDLSLTTIGNIPIDFNNIEEYISATLPAYMENLMLELFPTLESAQWTFPRLLAQTIIDNQMKYMHIGFVGACEFGVGQGSTGDYWIPWIVFSQNKVSDITWERSSLFTTDYISFVGENGAVGKFLALGETSTYASKRYGFTVLSSSYETDTNPIFNYSVVESESDGAWQTSTGYELSGDINDFRIRTGYLWNIESRGSSNFLNLGQKMAKAIVNNVSNDGYKLMTSAETYPVTNNYTNLQHVVNKMFVDAGLCYDGNVRWSLNPSGFDTNLSSYGCKYLSLYALVSPDGEWAMPMMFMTSVPVSSLSATIGEYSSTQDRCSATLTLSEEGNASMYRDANYLPAGQAVKVNAKYSNISQAAGWLEISGTNFFPSNPGRSTGTTWTTTYYVNRSGDGGSQNSGNVWEAGTFVGAQLVELAKNVDITDWSGSQPDPAYQRIDDSLYDGTFNVKGYIVFTEDNVDSILNDGLNVTDLADVVNTVPVDDSTSLIDGTTPVTDVESDINTNNGTNGSLEPVQVPRKSVSTSYTSFFSTLYSVNGLQLDNIAQAVSSQDWLDNALTKLSGNLVEGIFSLMAVPFAPVANTGNNDVIQSFGRPFIHDGFSVKGNKITNFKQTIDMGTIDLKEWNLTNSFRDYSPYTKAKIYLPFVGEVDLDLATILADNYNEAKLTLAYTVELYSGTAAIELKLTNGTLTDKTIYQTNAVVGMMLPVSGGTFGNILASLIGTIGGVAGSAIGLGIGGPLGGVAGSAIGHTISTPFNALGGNSASRSSSASANAGIISNLAPYITITQYNPAEIYSNPTYMASVGRPTYTVEKIEELSLTDKATFVKILSPQIGGIGATAEEKAELIRILEEGFWV